MSSTYPPLPYVIYPALLFFDSVDNIFIATLVVNAFINSLILLEAHKRFKNKRRENLFFISLALSGFGIGNLIYLGSNMPYSFIISSIFLIVGMSIDQNDKPSKDIYILIILFLLNYQVLFLIPAFLLIKSFDFIKKRKLPKKSLIASGTTLILIVSSSILFISARGNLTRTHENVGVNWNSGVNNEYVFDSSNKFSLEIMDFLIFLPRSIVYHFNEYFYNFKFFPIIFWFTILVIIIKDLTYKKLNLLNIFFYTSILTLFFLVLIGKAAYGPTRHTLFLLPLFCVFVFNNLIKYKFSAPIIVSTFMLFLLFKNINTILNRKNMFFKHVQNIHRVIQQKQNHDILLFSCTYQPFLEKKFRKIIENKKVFFFCGTRLQSVNSNLKSNDSLLIIDATGQNNQMISKEINKRIENKDFYYENEIKLYKEFLRLNHNMEQKDFTQLPKNTGLFIWETQNKL